MIRVSNDRLILEPYARQKVRYTCKTVYYFPTNGAALHGKRCQIKRQKV